MSDPLSIAGSVAGLVVLVEAVVSSIYEFSKDVAGAKDDINELLSGITALYGVLKSVELVSGRLAHTQPADAATPKVVTQCAGAMARIQERLQSASIEPNPPPSATGKASRARAAISGAKKRLLWPFKKKETQGLLGELEIQKATLSLALSADSLSGTLDVSAMQEVTHQAVSSIRNDQLAEIKRRLNQEQTDVLILFLAIDPTERYEDQLSLHHPGTGTWLLDCPEYKDFLNNPEGKLWLYGIPGAGKTVLTAVANQDISQRRTDRHASAFFLCTYKDKETQNLKNILSSLAAQVAVQDEDALAKLLLFHQKHNSTTQWSHSRLSKLLMDLASFFDSTTIIVDGLDECQQEDWRTITSGLVGLSRNTTGQCSVRLLLTSRKEHDIESELKNFAKVSIAARSSDLHLFVAEQLATRTANGSLKIKSPGLKTLILTKLTDGAQGMWQWAKCQLDTLCDLSNDAARRRALEDLPRTLHDTYERILERANKRDPENQKLLARCLRWIGVYDQFTVAQLAEAISIEADTSSIDPEAIPDDDDLLSICGSLAVKTTKGSIQFSHFSVREFLEQISPDDACFSQYLLDPEAGMIEAAHLLLTYLLFDDFDKPLPTDEEEAKKDMENHPLLRLAAARWHGYARPFMESNPHIRELAYELMGPEKSNNLLNWALAYMTSLFEEEQEEADYETLINICQHSTSLHWACHLNLPPTVRQLMDAGLDENKQSLWVRSMLSERVRTSRSPLIDELLHHFKREMPSLRIYQTPLECAILSPHREAADEHGRPVLVQSIIERDVSKDPEIHDLIPWAIMLEDVVVARLLVEHGFPITHRAIEVLDSADLQESLVKARWDEIEDLNATPELEIAFRQRSCPAMRHTQLASGVLASLGNSQAHEDSLKEIYLAAMYGRKAQLARYAGHFEDLLSIDIDALSYALIAAAERGHTDSVVYLIMNGANPRAKNSDGLTVLHILAEVGDADGCSMLLRLQGRIDGISSLLSMRDSSGWLPLTHAIYSGSMSLLRLFDKSLGSDAWATRDAKGDTLAHIAAQSGKQEIIDFLLTKGVSFNDANDSGEKPIHLFLLHARSYRETRNTFEHTFRGLVGVTDVCTPLPNGDNFFHCLARRYDLGGLKIFEECGSRKELVASWRNSKNYAGSTPLHEIMRTCARSTRSTENSVHRYVESMILRGDFNDAITDGNGCTPFMVFFQGREPGVRSMRKHDQLTFLDVLTTRARTPGSESMEIRDWMGRSLYHIMVDALSSPDALSVCFQDSTGLDLRDSEGRTPISRLAQRSGADLGLLEPLLRHAGQEHLLYPDNHGETLLHYLARRQSLGPSGSLRDRILLEIAQCTLRDEAGRIPLHFAAAKMKDFGACHELVSLVQDNINSLTHSGIRCVDFACQYGNVEMVSALLDAQDYLEIPGFSDQDDVSRTPLLTAAFFKHWDVVCFLLDRGANAAAVDSEGLGLAHYAAFADREELLHIIQNTANVDFCIHARYSVVRRGGLAQCVSPLHLAAAYGSPSTIRTYLDQLGSSIEDTTDRGDTPLSLACYRRNIEACNLLLAAGASVSGESKSGATPLCYSCRRPNLDIAKLLVNAGASVTHCRRDGRTSLHLAAKVGAADVVGYLLECGADPAQRDGKGLKAELMALKNGHKDVVDILRQHIRSARYASATHQRESLEEAEVCSITANEKSQWPQDVVLDGFRDAVDLENVEYVQSLIGCGFDVNVHDETGDCPLKTAILAYEEQIALLLIRSGAKCHPTSSATVEYATCGALHLAALTDLPFATKELLEDGAEIEKCADGMSPLHLSVWHKSDSTLEVMLAFLNTLATDTRHRILHQKVGKEGEHVGDYAIHLAARVERKRIVLDILRRGHEVDARNQGYETALHIAASRGSLDIANTLLEFGASTNARTSTGNTPLLQAMESSVESPEILELLIGWGADPFAKDIYGHGILHLAARSDSTQLVSWALSLQYRVNELDQGGHTALRYATSSPIIAMLIEAGAAMETFGVLGGPCLNNPELTHEGLATFLKHAEGLQAKTKAELLNFRPVLLGTPLYVAASGGKVENVRLLIEHGTEINAVGGEHGAPIQVAWKFGEYEVVKYLLSVGAEPVHLDDLAKEYSQFSWLSGGHTYRQARTGAWKIRV